jgi:hypothetical protein
VKPTYTISQEQVGNPIEGTIPVMAQENTTISLTQASPVPIRQEAPKKPKFGHAQYWNQQQHANDELTNLMKSGLTRVTKLEKKYMERKAQENDVEVPEEAEYEGPEDDPKPEPNPEGPYNVARNWITNM